MRKEKMSFADKAIADLQDIYAMQAESLRRRHRGYGYDLLFKNCHQFTSKCIGCEQHVAFPFWNLERHLKADYDFDHWEEFLTGA